MKEKLCAAPGCREFIPLRLSLCERHFKQIPVKLQAALTTAHYFKDKEPCGNYTVMDLTRKAVKFVVAEC